MQGKTASHIISGIKRIIRDDLHFSILSFDCYTCSPLTWTELEQIQSAGNYYFFLSFVVSVFSTSFHAKGVPLSRTRTETCTGAKYRNPSRYDINGRLKKERVDMCILADLLRLFLHPPGTHSSLEFPSSCIRHLNMKVPPFLNDKQNNKKAQN